MATRKKGAKSAEENKERKELIKVSAGAVSEIKERWSDENSVLFDCVIYDNIQLYSLALRYNDKDEPWISFPSRKGSDGKYYKYYYLEFAPDAIEKIEKALYPEG